MSTNRVGRAAPTLRERDILAGPASVFASVRRELAKLAALRNVKGAQVSLRVKGPALAHDRANLSALIFGEASKSPPDESPAELSIIAFARQLLNSRSFRVQVAEPALDGVLDAAPEVSAELAAWVEVTFGLSSVNSAGNRWELLARMLETPQMADMYDRVETPWSIQAVANALSASPHVSSPLCRLQRCARGVEVLALYHVEPAGDGPNIQLTSDDSWIEFRLQSDVALASPVCRIDFGMMTHRADPMPTLYLDYGDNSQREFQIALVPRGRSRYAAFVATDGLRTIRWKPDDAPGQARASLLTARPAPLDLIRRQLEISEGPAILARFDAVTQPGWETVISSQLQISRLLTRRLGGHEPSLRDYPHWIRRHELQGQEAQRIWLEDLGRLSRRPLMSLSLQTGSASADHIEETLQSVLAQVYPTWELCVPFDPHRQPAVTALLDGYAGMEPRIHPVCGKLEKAVGGLSDVHTKPQGEVWVARLWAGDVLAPQSLLRLAEITCERPDLQLIYSDEDRLDEDGQRADPWFKPEFSPELLLATNYLGPLVAIRAAALQAAGEWREGADQAGDVDLALRILERGGVGRIGHVPEVLVHSRQANRDWRGPEDVAAIRGYIERTGGLATIQALPNGDRRVRYTLPVPPPRVSLVIPTRDKADVLSRCIESILQRSTYPTFEVVIVDNGSSEENTTRCLTRLAKDKRVTVLRLDAPFNYSLINNFAVAQCRGDIIGLVNNDVEVITPDWIEELTSWAVRPDIGCVGAKLYYPSGRIQHAGVILGLGDGADHVHKNEEGAASGYRTRLQLHANVSAVTAACLFVRKELYEAMGGLDEALQVCFNDVDFCIRVRDAGYRNVFTPYAELYHYESLSRGSDEKPENRERFRQEIAIMRKRWGPALANDPFYSPNLTRKSLSCELRWLTD